MLLPFLALASFQGGLSEPPAPWRRTVVVGWNDEMDRIERWRPLDMENKARTSAPVPGLLALSLGHVPPGWPYTFQWSGVTQDMTVDLSRYPVLASRVVNVVGYAHLDIDVLNGEGKAVKTLRSNTLNEPGITQIDLAANLDPATYRLRVRLIVGGDNAGCGAIYRWIRFMKKDDAAFIIAHPDYTNVVGEPRFIHR